MKHLFRNIAALVLFAGWISLGAESIDTKISTFAQSLSTQIQTSARKKVAVLDLTDLQGNVNELGRYLAEQLTVGLVASRKDFSVVDRANLKKILDEHKLSISGLIDPENAKKLGQLSGVDALIIGNVTPFKSDVQVTAKIIATDTAEIVGAGVFRFPLDDEVKELVGRGIERSISQSGGSANNPATTNTVIPKPFDDLSKLIQIEKNSAQIGNLFVKIESWKITGDQYTGNILMTLIFVNTNTSTPITVAIDNPSGPNFGGSTVVRNHRGDEFHLSELSGMTKAGFTGYSDGSMWGNYTEIPPGKTVKATAKYYTRWNEKAGNYVPYRLQAEIWMGREVEGRFNGKKHNLLIDFGDK